MRGLLIFFIVTAPIFCRSQGAEVPSKLKFANINLKLTDALRKELQQEVNTLVRSPKHVDIMVQRARTYFPIIERVFKEEGLPEDFKYLALQESALIPDAVSSSKAVGYWQFKDFTAAEMGLRVDRHVDERMNIVSASRAAAGYLKKNNSFFNNWLYALQAYQMGAGGAMRVLDDKYIHATSMTLDKKTYWYVKKFLAHMIAYEGLIKGRANTELVEYYEGGGKSLKQLAQQHEVDEGLILEYNKWLKKGKVPDDKMYAILLPYSSGSAIPKDITSVRPPIHNQEEPAMAVVEGTKDNVEYRFPSDEDAFPEVTVVDQAYGLVEVNGLPAILARDDDDFASLAKRGNIDLPRLLKYNDVKIDHQIMKGQFYYLKKKRNKAFVHNHVVQHGETLWQISQKYGLKLKKLRSKNRIRNEKETLKPGRVMWLRFVRPASVDIAYRPEEVEGPVKPAKKKRVDSITATTEPEPGLVLKEESTKPKPGSILQQDSITNEEVPYPSVEKADKYTNEKEGSVVDAPQSTDGKIGQAETKAASVYVVKAGDTVYGIAKQFNVSVMKVLGWNSLSISDKIAIGQKLTVYTDKDDSSKLAKTKPVTNGQAYEYYTVQPGDTLYKIARSHNISVQELMELNDKTTFDIDYGEKIKVRKQVEGD